MTEKEQLEWTILDRIVREVSPEEMTFVQRPESSGRRVFCAKRDSASFSGIELGMFKKQNTNL